MSTEQEKVPNEVMAMDLLQIIILVKTGLIHTPDDLNPYQRATLQAAYDSIKDGPDARNDVKLKEMARFLGFEKSEPEPDVKPYR